MVHLFANYKLLRAIATNRELGDVIIEVALCKAHSIGGFFVNFKFEM